ncbi:MAG: efflux RND transporter periplasmic adaptor subunit [bacterium]|nr:efflux RND transporter periplasmic adaptor subunit [bacterium]
MRKIIPYKYIHKIKIYALKHKIISALAIIALAGTGYWIFKTTTSASGETRYITATAQKGTIVASISGSGQVSASNQVDLKPRASGDVVYVGVQNGQEVKAGTLIAQLNAQDAQKAARDAEVNLQSAKLSLEKLQKPADSLSVTQAENSLARAKESKQNSEDNLQKNYDNVFNTISNAFLDLPAVMAGLQDVLYSNTTGLGANGQQVNIDYYADAIAKYNATARQFKDDAANKTKTARTAYDTNFNDYKSASRFSDTNTIESLMNKTYETTKNIAEAVKSANNLIQFYKDTLAQRNVAISPVADTQLSILNSYTGKTNNHLTNLLTAKDTLQNNKDAIVNANRTIAENTESLAKLKSGADSLDIQSSQLTIRQRENALLDAKEKLADYFVRAPFDGTIAKLDVKKADSVTSATAVATMVTRQKLAEISLNEVDVSKIKIGQKTTITFDAVEGLSITGKVVEIDTVGTVTQGVVTYNVKLGFDTQDDRIKPGMSASANIITDVKQDVIVAPNSAVKSQNGASYVEIFDNALTAAQNNQGVVSPTLPRQQMVETGISNDTSTEIISGLTEGEQIVTRTISANSTQTAQQAPSIFGNIRSGGNTGSARGVSR